MVTLDKKILILQSFKHHVFLKESSFSLLFPCYTKTHYRITDNVYEIEFYPSLWLLSWVFPNKE